MKECQDLFNYIDKANNVVVTFENIELAINMYRIEAFMDQKGSIAFKKVIEKMESKSQYTIKDFVEQILHVHNSPNKPKINWPIAESV